MRGHYEYCGWAWSAAALVITSVGPSPIGDNASIPPHGADSYILRFAVTSQLAVTGASRVPSGRFGQYAISIRPKLKDT